MGGKWSELLRDTMQGQHAFSLSCSDEFVGRMYLRARSKHSLQINGGAQEHESLRLDDSKSLCGQWDTEDDGRNACEFLCLMQQIVECQAIYVGEMIPQEKQVRLDVFDEVQRCRSTGHQFRILMRLEGNVLGDRLARGGVMLYDQDSP